MTAPLPFPHPPSFSSPWVAAWVLTHPRLSAGSLLHAGGDVSCLLCARGGRTDGSIPWTRWTLLELLTLGISLPHLQPSPVSVHSQPARALPKVDESLSHGSAHPITPLWWDGAARPGGSATSKGRSFPRSSPAAIILQYWEMLPRSLFSSDSRSAPHHQLSHHLTLPAQHESPLRNVWLKQKEKDEEEGKARCPLRGSETEQTLRPSFSCLLSTPDAGQAPGWFPPAASLRAERSSPSGCGPPRLHVQTASDSFFPGRIILVCEITAFGALLGCP